MPPEPHAAPFPNHGSLSRNSAPTPVLAPSGGAPIPYPGSQGQRRALTGGDVEVDGLTVHLALLCVLHSCHRQAVALRRQQVPHGVGHELPVGHVAALDALRGGDVDDVPLHGTGGRLLPRHGHRGGGDAGGCEVARGERPWKRRERKGSVAESNLELLGSSPSARQRPCQTAPCGPTHSSTRGRGLWPDSPRGDLPSPCHSAS